MTIFFYVSITLFILLCAVLCLAILVQESKSLGLGASFGGDPGESLFGTSTADVLKKFTAWMAVCFLIACLVLSLWTGLISRSYQTLPPTIEEQASL